MLLSMFRNLWMLLSFNLLGFFGGLLGPLLLLSLLKSRRRACIRLKSCPISWDVIWFLALWMALRL
jgi:H+/Cl- antiporter ClcA